MYSPEIPFENNPIDKFALHLVTSNPVDLCADTTLTWSDVFKIESPEKILDGACAVVGVAPHGVETFPLPDAKAYDKHDEKPYQPKPWNGNKQTNIKQLYFVYYTTGGMMELNARKKAVNNLIERDSMAQFLTAA